ncbi:MAG: hypothetical protein II670_01195, partial [Alphaproteobacteria bacterium]|nr:hypothetical protein [Alphaproteobacteria bacterium]
KSPPQSERRCRGCMRELPLSEFGSAKTTKCRECEKKDKKKQRLILAILGALIVVMGIILMPKECSNNPKTPGGGNAGEGGNGKNIVDTSAFGVALSRYDFGEAYRQLKDKDDADKYYQCVKDSIDGYMLKCVCQEGNESKVISFWSAENINILNMIGLYEERDTRKKRWCEFYDDYSKIQIARNRKSINDKEYKEICGLIDKHKTIIAIRGEQLPQQWKNELRNKVKTESTNPSATESTNPSALSKDVALGKYKVEYTNKFGKKTVQYVEVGQTKKGWEASAGTRVYVTAPEGKNIKSNRRNSYTSEIIEEGRIVTITLEDSYIISFTGVKQIKTH